MTTAPQDNRGGNRPLAPQNNVGVNGLGGNGSADGVPNIDYTGFAYGQNKEINNQMKGASLNAATSTPSTKPIAGIFDKTGLPEQDVTDGNDGSTMVAPAMAIPEVESPVQMLQAIYMQDPTNQDVRFALEKLQQQGRI
jgi:hypothetical protein